MTGTQAASQTYRGRFAPSPTGPLHFGSLIAALASYLQARSCNGDWLIRIEDIDPTREQPGASDAILRSLEAHGFEFDTPLLQSTRLEAYDALIDELINDGKAYPCSCSRKELRASAAPGMVGAIYPGICRRGADTSKRPATSIRVITTTEPLSFNDLLQGTQTCRPESEIGDFLIRRGDGLVAYQLAVVADDYGQGISEVVRGTDLLEPTFMQIWLQNILGYPPPRHMHFPVACGPDGTKLSKQTGADSLDDNRASANLLEALQFLQQDVSSVDKSLSCKEILAMSVATWNPEPLRGVRNLTIRV